MNFVDKYGKSSGELDVGVDVETSINFHRDVDKV